MEQTRIEELRPDVDIFLKNTYSQSDDKNFFKRSIYFFNLRIITIIGTIFLKFIIHEIQFNYILATLQIFKI